MVQRQEEVTSAMQSREKSEDSSGLRSETSKEQLQSQLTEQREQLKELQESMQKTVLEARKQSLWLLILFTKRFSKLKKINWTNNCKPSRC